MLSILEHSTNTISVEKLGQEFLYNTRRGIAALVYSTAAFYGIGSPGTKRLIVTNIWETAHAYVFQVLIGRPNLCSQWGNVLVL